MSINITTANKISRPPDITISKRMDVLSASRPNTTMSMGKRPDIENDASTLKVIQGMVPDPANLPDGCKFHPRCPYATEACQTGKIKPVKLSDSHMVRCNRFSDTEV